MYSIIFLGEMYIQMSVNTTVWIFASDPAMRSMHRRTFKFSLNAPTRTVTN